MKKRQQAINITKRIAIVACGLIILGGNANVLAYTRDDVTAMVNGTQWYDPNGGCDTGNNNSGGSTIVIDPGHSGNNIISFDGANGIEDHDYPNNYENEEVFYVALMVKKKLAADGYKAILTKGDDITTNVTGVDDSNVKKGAGLDMGLRARADVANKSNAALALSIHDDHAQNWNSFAQVYTQKVGLYRKSTKTGQTKTFNNQQIAALSQKYGGTFASARKDAEGHNVTLTDINFGGRQSQDPASNVDDGNLPIVQLYSNVPWVYNEVGGGSGLLGKDQLDKYAKGLVDGVEKSVKPDTGSGAASGTPQGSSVSSASLNGFTLPTTSGKTGKEESADANGTVPSGGRLGFSQFAGLKGKNGVNYRDYYINMRWTFASWAWNGSSQITNQKELSWMSSAPRKVLVTNPKSHKSIIAVIMETGPAPFVGSSWWRDHGHDTGNVPPYWHGYEQTTPSGYDGIYSGFPQTALDALGLKAGDLGYEGPGVALNYAWAPDQNADAGPTNLVAGDTASGTGCSQGNVNGSAATGLFNTILQYAWYDGSGCNPVSSMSGCSWTFKGVGFTSFTKAYAAAVADAPKKNQYDGAGGVDCGGFITLLMQNSGADPDYNKKERSNVAAGQYPYLQAHPDKYKLLSNVKTAKDLRPGDIFIARDLGHTFIFVGDEYKTGSYAGTVGDRYKGDSASSSLGDRSPMASTATPDYITTGRWYRPTFLGN